MRSWRAFALRRKLPRSLASLANVGVTQSSWALDLKRLGQSLNEPRARRSVTRMRRPRAQAKPPRLPWIANAVPHCFFPLDLDQTRLRHFACTDVAPALS